MHSDALIHTTLLKCAYNFYGSEAKGGKQLQLDGLFSLLLDLCAGLSILNSATISASFTSVHTAPHLADLTRTHALFVFNADMQLGSCKPGMSAVIKWQPGRWDSAALWLELRVPNLPLHFQLPRVCQRPGRSHIRSPIPPPLQILQPVTLI